jgi:hypothetical protein
MLIGSYAELSLSKPERPPKSYRRALRWVMTLPGEKQERKAEALAKMEAEKTPCAFQILPPNTLSADPASLEAPRHTTPPNRQGYKSPALAA